MASSSAVAELEPTGAQPAAPRRRWFRLTLPRVIGLIMLTALLWEPYHVFVGDNVHPVVPGKVYRGAQPNGALIRTLVQRHGIRTIVNLRGYCHPQSWYVEEAQTAQDLGLALEDICFSAGRWPSQHEVRAFVEVLDQAEYPLFMHCRHGADRTGLASVIAQILLADQAYAKARGQLSLRFGHAPVGRSTILDRFFGLYESWLKTSRRTHDQTAFRHWLLEEYQGGVCQSVIEEAMALQDVVRVGEPISWRIRVRNASTAPWHFKPTRTAGVHLGFYLWDAKGAFVSAGRGGMFERTVQPGESITVALVVPPVKTPGRYRVLIDMIEEGHCWFYQTGSEPYEEEIDVRK
jgi:protein tyrosine phosphatase (PTP) superfamily phosphohydrolase (DUF442 family)